VLSSTFQITATFFVYWSCEPSRQLPEKPNGHFNNESIPAMPQPKMRLTLFTLSLFYAIFFAGCGPRQDEESFAGLTTRVSVGGALDKAMDLVNSDLELNADEYEENVSTDLRRWMLGKDEEYQKLSANWKPSPLVKELPKSIQAMDLVSKLDTNFFFRSDANYAKESSWLKSLAQRLKGSNVYNVWPPVEPVDYENGGQSNDALADALEKIHPELGKTEREQLAIALRFFDWTTRAIQLSSTPPKLTDDEVVEQRLVIDDQIDGFSEMTLPELGIRGPGYSHYPWQTLLYGTGDFLERASIFIGLCHQEGIDAVVLETGKPENRVTRLTGVLIGQQVFLFDSKMGLAIPGKNGRIATLAEAKSDASILDSLDLTLDESLSENRSYPIKSDDLKDVSALICASPEQLSVRMKILENTLSGDKRLVLTKDLEKLNARLESNEGISATRLWEVPFQTHLFQTRVQKALKEANSETRLQSRLIWKAESGEAFADSYLIYRTAKTRYFQGVFEKPTGSEKMSSLNLFAKMRYTDEDIQNLPANDFIVNVLKIRRAGQSSQDFERRIQSTRIAMQSVRIDASYFLGVLNFETNSPSSALNWLARVTDYDSDGRWKTGADYLAARCHETLGDNKVAIEKLKSDEEKPQAFGNLIRARFLSNENNTANSND